MGISASNEPVEVGAFGVGPQEVVEHALRHEEEAVGDSVAEFCFEDRVLGRVADRSQAG